VCPDHGTIGESRRQQFVTGQYATKCKTDHGAELHPVIDDHSHTGGDGRQDTNQPKQHLYYSARGRHRAITSPTRFAAENTTNNISGAATQSMASDTPSPKRASD
jgi:hypothetical protein